MKAVPYNVLREEWKKTLLEFQWKAWLNEEGMSRKLASELSTFFTQYESYIRILISALLGLLIGFERTHKNKPAGVKTYTIVSVASAVLTLVSIHSVESYGHLTERTMMDPMRLVAQIVSGLGFIGAGLIMKTGFEVKGLTSAAMILYTGGVGIGIGAGFYGMILFAMLVTFAIVRLGSWIEKKEHSHLISTDNEERNANIS